MMMSKIPTLPVTYHSKPFHWTDCAPRARIFFTLYGPFEGPEPRIWFAVWRPRSNVNRKENFVREKMIVANRIVTMEEVKALMVHERDGKYPWLAPDYSDREYTQNKALRPRRLP